MTKDTAKVRITLDYGKTGLEVELPEDRVVGPLTMKSAAPLADPTGELERALKNPIGLPPLSDLAKGRKNTCILVCDITRPVPNRVILPPILRTLEECGIPRADILILIATGMHRPNEGRELEELLGPEIVGRYPIENHHGKTREEHDFLGVSPNGVPIWPDSRYVRADLKITTGLIEPHMWAGYSGGRKVICPGIAGQETIKAWHSPRFLEHPKADSGILEGNPVHKENTRIAQMAGCDFIVNVCLDEERRVTWLGAGDMIRAWEQGVRFMERVAKVPVPEPLDIVVTSGAGYPLDTTWYQAIKGLSGVLPIIKPGGTIILAASLSEGVGSPDFQRLMADNPDLKLFKESIQGKDCLVVDQWELEEQAMVMERCKVKVVSDGVPPEILRRCHVEPASSVEEAVDDCLAEYGPSAKIGVVPKGPYVVPYIM